MNSAIRALAFTVITTAVLLAGCGSAETPGDVAAKTGDDVAAKTGDDVAAKTDRVPEKRDAKDEAQQEALAKDQAELEQKPDAILFYNDGVKLCCEGSTLLDDLRGLEAAGVEIIACGTCLNFFELADQLRVGRVTDMLEIAGRLADAGTIVRP